MSDAHYDECNSGDSPLLTFRLQQAGAPWPVNSGYTIQLVGEVADTYGALTALPPVTCSSGEVGAVWASGIVTVRVPATWTSGSPQRVSYGLLVTATASPHPVVQTDSGTLLVLHTPGATPPL